MVSTNKFGYSFSLLLVCLHIQILKCDNATDDQQIIPPKFHMDDYENCMLLSHDAPYCMVTVELMPVDKTNTGSLWQAIEDMSTQPTHYRHDILRHGVCVPHYMKNDKNMNHVEPRAQLEKFYQQKYQGSGLNGTIVDMRCIPRQQQKGVDYFDKFFACAVCGYIAVVLFSSLVDYNMSADTKQGWSKLIRSLSITRNWKRLSSIKDKGDISDNLKSIQGIRFYNMVCVILVHTLLFYMVLPSLNPQYMEEKTDSFSTKLFSNPGYAILTNFLISIWLLTLKILSNPQKYLEWNQMVKIFCYRLSRLLPGLAIIVGFQATWFRYTDAGPFWEPIVGKQWSYCRNNGWSNLLFLNVLYKPSQMCLIQTWSLTVDVQLFLLALLVLKLLHSIKSKHVVYCFLLMWIAQHALHWLYVFVNNYKSMVNINIERFLNFEIFVEEATMMAYMSAISNLSGLMAGIVFAYLQYNSNKSNPTARWRMPLVRWTLVVLGTLGNVLVGGFTILNRNYKYNVWFAATYETLGRTVFAFTMGFMIFSMARGHGGILKRFLEWKPTFILGRLSYAVFLIHMTILEVKFGATRQPIYLSDWNMLYDTVATITLSYLLAVPYTLFFEMPVSAMFSIEHREGNPKKD